MAKFDGVSGAGAPKGADPLLYESSEFTSVQRGRQTGGVFGNYEDGAEIGDGFGTPKEPLTQADINSIKSLTNSLKSAKTKEDLDAIFCSEEYSDVLMTIYSDSVKILPAQEKVVHTFFNTLNAKSMAILDRTASENYSDFSGDVQDSVDSVVGHIMSQLNQKNMTKSEKTVLSALRDVLNGVKTLDEALQSLPNQKDKSALQYAYESSGRDSLKTRSKFGDAHADFSKQVRDKAPSEQELIYWVKSAYNDFGLAQKGATTEMGRLVDIAVSEALYDGGETITAEAREDIQFIYMQAHTARMNPSEVLYASQRSQRQEEGIDDGQFSIVDIRAKIKRGELPTREEAAYMQYITRNDPDGGQQGTYAGFLQGLADTIYGGGDFLREANNNSKTITRRRN